MKLTNLQYKQLMNTSLTYKANKYHNKKVLVDGIKFDSVKESNRWLQLKQLERARIITDLQRQVSYELQPKFELNGIKYRAINYIADFVYKIDNKEIIEDVKSEATRKDKVYKLKKKMMAYKGYEIKEI